MRQTRQSWRDLGLTSEQISAYVTDEPDRICPNCDGEGGSGRSAALLSSPSALAAPVPGRCRPRDHHPGRHRDHLPRLGLDCPSEPKPCHATSITCATCGETVEVGP